MNQTLGTVTLFALLLLSAACGFGDAVGLQQALDAEYGYESVRVSQGDAKVEVTIHDTTFSPAFREGSEAQAEELAGFIAGHHSPVHRADSLVLILTNAGTETSADQPGLRVEATWRGRFSFGASELEGSAAETER